LRLKEIFEKLIETNYTYEKFCTDVKSTTLSKETQSYLINNAREIFKSKNIPASRYKTDVEKLFFSGLREKDNMKVFTNKLNSVGIVDSELVKEYQKTAKEIIDIRESNAMNQREKNAFIGQTFSNNNFQINLEQLLKNYNVKNEIEKLKSNLRIYINNRRNQIVSKVLAKKSIPQETLQGLASLPYYRQLKENTIYKTKQQNNNIWLDDNDMKKLVRNLSRKTNKVPIDKLHCAVMPSSQGNRATQEYYKKDYQVHFTKPLHDFAEKLKELNQLGKLKTRTNLSQGSRTELISSEWRKFSAVLTKGMNHWVSVNVIPDRRNSKIAYVLYNDSIGNSIPKKLKQSILKEFPKAKIVSSRERKQFDSSSCGSFAALNTVGIRSVRNSDIAKIFNGTKSEENIVKQVESAIRLQEKNQKTPGHGIDLSKRLSRGFLK
jgi:hypothetical protein